jgi:hypothetical protein
MRPQICGTVRHACPAECPAECILLPTQIPVKRPYCLRFAHLGKCRLRGFYGPIGPSLYRGIDLFSGSCVSVDGIVTCAVLTVRLSVRQSPRKTQGIALAVRCHHFATHRVCVSQALALQNDCTTWWLPNAMLLLCNRGGEGVACVCVCGLGIGQQANFKKFANGYPP